MCLCSSSSFDNLILIIKSFVDLKIGPIGSLAVPQGKAKLGKGVSLTTKAVEGAALAFEGIDDVHGSDCLPLSVLGVGDGVTDDVLKEHLQDTTGLFVDQSGDTLDSTTAGQTADGGLGNTLDVITKNLAMTLGASLSESLASLATSCHDAD